MDTDNLSERCAKLLGWENEGINWWLAPFSSVHVDLPDFEHSLDACLQYLWPELQRRGWEYGFVEFRDDGKYDAGIGKQGKLNRDPPPKYVGADGDTPPQAFCLAFIAAMEGEG